MSDRDTPTELIEDVAAGITARSCGYGSCDRMRGHDGPHRCRCSKPVDGPANGCKWHTPGPTSVSDRDTLADLIDRAGFDLERGTFRASWTAAEREAYERASHPHSLARITAVQELRRADVAEFLLARGVRPPAREITDPAAFADERTGTILRSKHGDIVSIDHGPVGEWTGMETRVNVLGPFAGPPFFVGEMSIRTREKWTVLYVPTEEAETDGE